MKLETERRLRAIESDVTALEAGAVIGPASSTDHAAARFDLATGKLLQDSDFLIDDSGHVTSFGGQITFPATAADSAGANTLDDYEEGTFTPGISFGNGTTGITYTTQVGKYTKVGNLVTAFAYVILSAKGTSTGAVRVTGFPFTAVNTANVRTTCFQYITGGATTITGSPFGILVENTTSTLLQQIITGTASSLNDTHFADTTATISTIPYYTS